MKTFICRALCAFLTISQLSAVGGGFTKKPSTSSARSAISNVANPIFTAQKQPIQQAIIQQAQASAGKKSRIEFLNKSLLEKGGVIYDPQDININSDELAFDDSVMKDIELLIESLDNNLSGGMTNPPALILFGGPPGTGKTTLFLMLAKKLNIPLITFNSAIATKGDVDALCREADAHAPCIVLIDEIDSIAKSRALGGEVGPVTEILQVTNREKMSAAQILKEFYSKSSRPKGSRPAITILGAATNAVEQLDDAVLSRANYKWIGNPGFAARAKVWSRNLAKVLSEGIKTISPADLSMSITNKSKLSFQIEERHPLIRILTENTNNYSPREISIILDNFVQQHLSSPAKKKDFIEKFQATQAAYASAKSDSEFQKFYQTYFEKLVRAILLKKRDALITPIKSFASLTFPFEVAFQENVFDYTLSSEIISALDKFRTDIQSNIVNYNKGSSSLPKVGRAVLFDGPPGTAKTVLCQVASKKFGYPILTISSANVITQFVGSGQANIKQIFMVAKALAPCIIFIDEMDSITPNRQTVGQNETQKIDTVTALLTAMNENDNKLDPANPVIIFGATNLAKTMDPAITRRMMQLLVLYPNTAGRIAILESVIKQAKKSIKPADLNRLQNEFAKYVYVAEEVLVEGKTTKLWRRPNNNDLFAIARNVVGGSSPQISYDQIILALKSYATKGFFYSKDDYDRYVGQLKLDSFGQITRPTGYENYRAFEDSPVAIKSKSSNLIVMPKFDIISPQEKQKRMKIIKQILKSKITSFDPANALVEMIVELISSDTAINENSFEKFARTLISGDFGKYIEVLLRGDSSAGLISSKYIQSQRGILLSDPSLSSDDGLISRKSSLSSTSSKRSSLASMIRR